MKYIIGVVIAILWFVTTMLVSTFCEEKPKLKKGWNVASTVGIILVSEIFPTIGLTLVLTLVVILVCLFGFIYIKAGKEEFKKALLEVKNEVFKSKKESKEAA